MYRARDHRFHEFQENFETDCRKKFGTKSPAAILRLEYLAKFKEMLEPTLSALSVIVSVIRSKPWELEWVLTMTLHELDCCHPWSNDGG